MTIGMILPLPAGNALRVFIEPPASARLWRLLRKTANNFTGEADPDAVVVYEGQDVKAPLDSDNILNGFAYWYRAYYWDGTSWTASTSVTATCASTYEEATTDVLSVVRDRLDYGLQAEVARNVLTHETGAIPVLTAPPLYEDTRWPVVSVHLQSETSSLRAVGEEVELGELDVLSGDWDDAEGWFANTQLTIVGWSLNPDERVALRKAMRRIVIANFPVFASSGFVNIDFSVQDMDAVSGEYPAPVYQVMCTFTCLAPVVVRSPGPLAIREVQVQPNIITP